MRAGHRPWEFRPLCPAFLLVGALCVSAMGTNPELANVPGVTNVTRTSTEFSLPLSASPAEISAARVFDEPLVPIGGQPTAAENRELSRALTQYSRRAGPDDFKSLETFVENHAESPWTPSLLTAMGIEYYNTAHYSRALDAWGRAWARQAETSDAAGFSVMNRAVAELAYLYARLGRMTELAPLLKSVQERPFFGGPRQKIDGAKEALWMMENRPEVAFRCGPLALHRIKLATDPSNPCTDIIHQSASTQKGFSLRQVRDLSEKVGLNYQMAFREKNGEFLVPSVVHWKAGHYAALLRKVDDRYLVEDPTFGNSVWPTRQALESESSGYFLVGPGELPPGWRKVNAAEGERIFGKGQTAGNDGDVYTCTDAQTSQCGPEGCSGLGMPVPSIHLMVVNLQVRDTPLGYSPPVGPPVNFMVRFNSRSQINPNTVADLSPMGVGWTHDWAAWITDQPQSPMADVKYHVGGGGARTFTGFDPATQRFAFQQLDQTRLTRTSTNSYELTWPDGSKKVFAQPDGAVGSTRRVFLTQVIDNAGNALTLNYDASFRLVTVTDAIGQVTTLSYELPTDPRKITRVTDPFGRSTVMRYRQVIIGYAISGNPPVSHAVYGFSLLSITDVLGLTSEVDYLGNLGGALRSLVTPYGTNTFTWGGSGTTRFAEISYPDGSRERVEYNQLVGIPGSESPMSVPKGMATLNQYLQFRNTYYWSRTACASGYGDYSKAQIFHWLHTADMSTTAGILESTKQPLENRVWRDYAGQSSPIAVGRTDEPAHIGRVLDDGSTQLYSYAYNGFGHVTNYLDPLGRTLSLTYSTNGVDLLEVRQTRAGKNELLASATYNSQHRPLSVTDASGQTHTFTWNPRGQIASKTDPRGDTVRYSYDVNGYLTGIDRSLPGTNDSVYLTYDAFGRPRTMRGVAGSSVTLDYDALNRITRVTYQDGTFTEATYDRLSLVATRDRAGRTTTFENNNMQQVVRRVDPSGRVTHFDWCSCGELRSITDPMGRTTTWLTDVQGRRTAKVFPDGSQVTYSYENTSSRLRLVVDELLQSTAFIYNRDNTLHAVHYGNTSVQTPSILFTYDPDYERTTAITDGSGTTVYSYYPILSNSPSLGAGRLASVDGPLEQDTITFAYDALGRAFSRSLNGVDDAIGFDAIGRLIHRTNLLGSFSYTYNGDSFRRVSELLQGGLSSSFAQAGAADDFHLEQISHAKAGSPISKFNYGYDSSDRITTWSQQWDTQPASTLTLGYDAADQLVSANSAGPGAQAGSFAYTYDPAGNRLLERANGVTYEATYNALNQLSTSTAPGRFRTNEWDAAHRLVAVNSGSQRTEFTYNGQNQCVAIRQLVNGAETSRRLFVWDGSTLREERNTNGVVIKRFFSQGVQIATGSNAGVYYYTRDHLGSVRELIDASGAVRARYSYDPFGRRTKVSGDLDTDLGFAGMFWCAEAGLALTRFRAYDPNTGRWLSRDPIRDAELLEGPNLYAYVRNNPINLRDPEGLCTGSSLCGCFRSPAATAACQEAGIIAGSGGGTTAVLVEENLPALETLPAAAARAPAAIQCAATRVAQVFDVVETRVAALQVSYRETAATLSQGYADRIDAMKYLDPQILRRGVPLWTDTMIKLDREFHDLALILAARFNISNNEAWNMLARMVGFNPELW